MTMRLETMRIQRQPGYSSQEDLAETKSILIGVEEELRKLLRLYDELMSFPDARD